MSAFPVVSVHVIRRRFFQIGNLSVQRLPRPCDACDLAIVIVADTPCIAAAVIDSLPDDLSYFLVGPRSVAFLGRSSRCREYFVNALSVDERDRMHFVRTIQRLGSVNANLFIIPADDSATRLLHSTADELGAPSYPIPDSVSFERLNDKWQFYQYCSQLGVRVPKTVLLRDKSEIDFENLCTAVGLPLVVKPTNKSNSLGVQVICSKDDFRKKISLKRYNFSPLIAQSFVPGLDIDISALVDRGHMEKFAVQIRKEGTIYFVRNEELVQMAEVIVRELRYTGVIHIDARLHESSKEVFLIEANPRFWGSLAAATVGGLNFVRAGIYTALGLDSSDPFAISDVSVPSPRRLLAEIVTFKRSYLRMHPVERLRLQRAMRVSIRRKLRLP
jgi:hypothetical protein